MKRLRTFTITNGVIAFDADFVGNPAQAPDAADVFDVPLGSTGVEVVGLLTNTAGAPVGAVGTYDLEVVEILRRDGVDRYARAEALTTQAMGDWTQILSTGKKRAGRKVALRVHAVASLPTNGTLEIWIRHA